MIHWISHDPSPGLAHENAIHEANFRGCDVDWMRTMFPTIDNFLGEFRSSADGLQFIHAVSCLPPSADVLDIGAGTGRTSLHLALQGHRVAVAEPAAALCRYIDSAATLYNLDLDIFNLPGEDLDRIAGRRFDACIFHGSLHHCDDPVRALRHCHAMIRPAGRLLLTSEPILRRNISKERFEQILAEDGLPAGDYGGNEHSYYFHEYLDMLRDAGFSAIQSPLVYRYRRPADYLRLLHQEGKTGRLTFALRHSYYALIRGLDSLGIVGRPLLSLLKRSSLLQVYFTAQKPAATRAAA